MVGYLDGFVANLVDLGCGNGGLWAMEVAVGGSGGGWGFGFAVLQNLHMREGGTDKVSCGRKCKKINKEIIFE